MLACTVVGVCNRNKVKISTLSRSSPAKRWGCYVKSTRFIWGQFKEEKWFLWSIRSRGVAGSILVSSAISQINFSTSGRNKASTARENCQVRLPTLKLPFQKRENVVNYLIRLGSWSWSLICFFNQGPVESTIITILFSCNKHLVLTSDYQGIWHLILF